MGSKAFELCEAIFKVGLNLYVCKVMSCGN